MKTMLMATALLLGMTALAFAHCQVPCGIYDDEARIARISENIDTIEKAMREIVEMSDDELPNYNQIVRWVEVKEQHADEIAHIVSWYFLQQRIKPADQSDEEAYAVYIRRLKTLHNMLIYTMKAKQTIDFANTQELRSQFDDFSYSYLGE
jgi:nickel superoxide dismutase